jgi:hypothetical protein
VTSSLHRHPDEAEADTGEAYAETGEAPLVGPDPLDQVTEPPPPASGNFFSRLRSGGLDLRNTWQILAGAILLPLGVAVIVLGWNGAAHGRVDQQQIPYLISGGILGLACVLVGCFFFWAHWLYRIYDQADLHHQTAMRQQADLFRALIDAVERRAPAEGETAGPAAPRPGGRRRRAAPSTNGSAPTFVATPNGNNYHTPSCPIVANRVASLREVSAEEAHDMRPCRICEPLQAG